MSPTTRERAQKALKAMKALGLRDEDVKPILKHLLKVFDKNWELIEAEEYRALIDAYFESKEKKTVEDDDQRSSGKSAHPERPFKRQHFEEKKEDQVSCNKKKTNDRIVVDLTEKKLPVKANPHGSVVGSSSGMKNLTSQRDASRSNDSKHDDHNLVIASSTSGKVKVLLNIDSAVKQPNFRVPDLREVLKSLQDKYLRIHRVVTPQFSLRTLLKDLCESYIDSSYVSNKRSEASSSIHDLGRERRALEIGNSATASKTKAPDSRTLSSTDFVRVKQEGMTSGDKKYRPNITDVAKGTENVQIPLVDEFGCEEFPKFRYMPQSTVYQNAYIKVSLARISDGDCCSSCSTDCVSSRIPCACASETGGEFAYTREGLLRDKFLRDCLSRRRNPQKEHFAYCQDCPLERAKDEYLPENCKGHLFRKFIKECWRKCGCDMNCGNRVVQRGITCNLEVFLTREGKGWGLRTLKDLPAGTFVCEYAGEILTNAELYERNNQSSGCERHTYPVTLDADWGSEKFLRDEEALCLDATFFGNVARFINHRCNDANLIDIPVEVETPDRHYYHLAFFTSRKVKAMEELTWDYGIDFDDLDHPIKAFQCRCGSLYCQDLKGKGHLHIKSRNDKKRG